MKRKLTLGEYQLWGDDEVRIYTMRGWIICRKGKEMQEELNLIASLLPPSQYQRSSPPLT